jgi:guanylate kinase
VDPEKTIFIVFTGPRAAGKTTLASYLAEHQGMRRVPSITTREARPDDPSDEYRYYVRSAFMAQEAQGYFAWANQYEPGMWYATAKSDIAWAISNGGIWVMCLIPDQVDVLVRYLETAHNGQAAVLPFFLVAGVPERARRLRGRGWSEVKIRDQELPDANILDKAISARSTFRILRNDTSVEETSAKVMRELGKVLSDL